MDRPSTYETQYNIVYDIEKKHGRSKLGLMINESWNCDPRRTLFTLSRYKFVSKMLSGCENVLEVGCADAFGTRLVQQTVGHVTATDIDPVFINDVKSRYNPNWPMDVCVHNMMLGPFSSKNGKFDAAFCLDVLEHIEESDEDVFLKNIRDSIRDDGSLIVGMPSLESQSWASKQSKEGHVNCKNGDVLKKLMKKYFKNVLIFSMNDEIVHTGFFPMSHYLFAVCSTPITGS